MKIVKATINDINQIEKLLYQVHKVHSDARPDLFIAGKKKYNKEELIKIINNENTPIFVYKKENIILGYAFVIYKIENSDSLVNIKTMYVDDFCVDENYKHQGIGTKLFDFLKDEAKKQNCYNITLNVYNFNKAAKAFYEKQQLKELKTYMELIVK